jgi:hypothetical protein
VLTMPPHNSHRLQPLDAAAYGPFKRYFNEEADSFLINNPGQTISLKHIPELVGRAYRRAFVPKKTISGFCYNRNLPL